MLYQLPKIKKNKRIKFQHVRIAEPSILLDKEVDQQLGPLTTYICILRRPPVRDF